MTSFGFGAEIAGAEELPAKVCLSYLVPEVRDQGVNGNCEAQTIATLFTADLFAIPAAGGEPGGGGSERRGDGLP